MAYVSVAWAIIQTFVWVGIELYAPGFIASAATVIGWSYGTASTIIIGYFGNTAVETYREEKKYQQSSTHDNYRQEPRQREEDHNNGPWNDGGI